MVQDIFARANCQSGYVPILEDMRLLLENCPTFLLIGDHDLLLAYCALTVELVFLILGWKGTGKYSSTVLIDTKIEWRLTPGHSLDHRRSSKGLFVFLFSCNLNSFS